MTGCNNARWKPEINLLVFFFWPIYHNVFDELQSFFFHINNASDIVYYLLLPHNINKYVPVPIFLFVPGRNVEFQQVSVAVTL